MRLSLPITFALVMTSSLASADPLDTWTQRNVLGGAGIAYADGHWSTRGAISTDGVTWTPQATSIPVHVVKANGLYVAADTQLLTSTDGTQWTPQLPNWAPGYRQIAGGGAGFVVATAGSSYAYSADGTVWALRLAPLAARGIRDVVFLGGQFVAATEQGVWTSTDANHWSQRSTTGTLRAIAYGNGRYVAVGTRTAQTSTDGVQWTSTPIYLADLQAVAFGDGMFVAVGPIPNSPKTAIATSKDGTTWTMRTPLAAWGSNTEIAYSGGRFVIALNSNVGAAMFASALPDKVSVTPTNTMTGSSVTAPKIAP